jgi:hypothetical protein
MRDLSGHPRAQSATGIEVAVIHHEDGSQHHGQDEGQSLNARLHG